MAWLFALLLFFVLFGSGYVDTSDADASIETARSLIERGSLLARPAVPDFQYYARTSECCVTKMGWIHPLLYAPPLWLASKIPFAERWRLESFLLSFVNPMISSLIVLFLFQFFRKKHCDGVAALVSAGSFAASILLPYSKSSHREILHALLLLLAYSLLDTQKSGFRQLLLLFAAITASILSKIALAIPLVPVFILLLHRTLSDEENRLKVLIAFLGLAVLPMILSRLLYGEWLSFGYGAWVSGFNPAVWSTPFWHGLFQQLFSWSDGYWIHNPWFFLLAPTVLWKFRTRSFSHLDLALIAAFLLQACLYSKWFSPIGREALGPRYLVATTPLLIMMLRGFPFESLGRLAKLGLALILIFSILWQGIHSSIKIQSYWTLQARLGTLQSPHWAVNVSLFQRKLARDNSRLKASDFGGESEKTTSLDDVPTMRGMNYWWAHLGRMNG